MLDDYSASLRSLAGQAVEEFIRERWFVWRITHSAERKRLMAKATQGCSPLHVGERVLLDVPANEGEPMNYRIVARLGSDSPSLMVVGSQTGKIRNLAFGIALEAAVSIAELPANHRYAAVVALDDANRDSKQERWMNNSFFQMERTDERGRSAEVKAATMWSGTVGIDEVSAACVWARGCASRSDLESFARAVSFLTEGQKVHVLRQLDIECDAKDPAAAAGTRICRAVLMHKLGDKVEGEKEIVAVCADDHSSWFTSVVRGDGFDVIGKVCGVYAIPAWEPRIAAFV